MLIFVGLIQGGWNHRGSRGDCPPCPHKNGEILLVVSVVKWLACRAGNENVAGSNHGLATCDCKDNNLGQFVNTNMPRSTLVNKWVPGW